MKERELWHPTKFVKCSGKWVASSDRGEVGIGSRFIADIACQQYERVITTFASGKLLDVGCGKVPLYGIYNSLVSSATCIDWPGSMHGLRHVDLTCDLSEAIPLADSSFDTVLASDVLEHLPNVELCWSEMVRLLRPGGHLIIGVPFMYWVHEAPNDYGRYTEYALARLAKLSSLEITELYAYGGSPEVFCDLALKHMSIAPSLANLFYHAARYFVRVPLVKQLSMRTRALFPLGYILVARKPVATRR